MKGKIPNQILININYYVSFSTHVVMSIPTIFIECLQT